MSTARAEWERGVTHRDLDDTPDDGNLWEVIDGRIHVSPHPTPAHQNVIAKLTALLVPYVEQHDLGKIFPAAIKVVLDEPSGVGPDLVFIAKSRLNLLRDDGFYGAPDLVGEVISSRPALDRVIKRDKYARSGVPRYWIIDPTQRTLDTMALDGERYGAPTTYHDGDRFEPDLFPGLVIELRALWL